MNREVDHLSRLEGNVKKLAIRTSSLADLEKITKKSYYALADDKISRQQFSNLMQDIAEKTKQCNDPWVKKGFHKLKNLVIKTRANYNRYTIYRKCKQSIKSLAIKIISRKKKFISLLNTQQKKLKNKIAQAKVARQEKVRIKQRIKDRRAGAKPPISNRTTSRPVRQSLDSTKKNKLSSLAIKRSEQRMRSVTRYIQKFMHSGKKMTPQRSQRLTSAIDKIMDSFPKNHNARIRCMELQACVTNQQIGTSTSLATAQQQLNNILRDPLGTVIKKSDPLSRVTLLDNSATQIETKSKPITPNRTNIRDLHNRQATVNQSPPQNLDSYAKTQKIQKEALKEKSTRAQAKHLNRQTTKNTLPQSNLARQKAMLKAQKQQAIARKAAREAQKQRAINQKMNIPASAQSNKERLKIINEAQKQRALVQRSINEAQQQTVQDTKNTIKRRTNISRIVNRRMMGKATKGALKVFLKSGGILLVGAGGLPGMIACMAFWYALSYAYEVDAEIAAINAKYKRRENVKDFKTYLLEMKQLLQKSNHLQHKDSATQQNMQNLLTQFGKTIGIIDDLTKDTKETAKNKQKMHHIGKKSSSIFQKELTGDHFFNMAKCMVFASQFLVFYMEAYFDMQTINHLRNIIKKLKIEVTEDIQALREKEAGLLYHHANDIHKFQTFEHQKLGILLNKEHPQTTDIDNWFCASMKELHDVKDYMRTAKTLINKTATKNNQALYKDEFHYLMYHSETISSTALMKQQKISLLPPKKKSRTDDNIHSLYEYDLETTHNTPPKDRIQSFQDLNSGKKKYSPIYIAYKGKIKYGTYKRYLAIAKIYTKIQFIRQTTGQLIRPIKHLVERYALLGDTASAEPNLATFLDHLSRVNFGRKLDNQEQRTEFKKEISLLFNASIPIQNWILAEERRQRAEFAKRLSDGFAPIKNLPQGSF